MRSMMVAAIAACAGGSVAALLALSVQGCSSSDAATPQSDAGDAGVVDAANEAADDAAPNIDQPPNVYPAQHQPIPQMTSRGGPVLTSMQIVTVTFAGDPKRDSLRTYTDFIVKSGWWDKVMIGFGVGKGSSGGHVELVDSFGADAGASVAISDDDIQALLQAKITSGELPRPIKGVTAYALYFQKNVTIGFDGKTSCTEFGGYHRQFMANVPASAGADGGGPADTFEVAYAIMPRCAAYPVDDAVSNFNQLTVTASHELAEMASDPFENVNTGFLLETDDSWLPSFYAPGSPIENGDACSNPYNSNAESYDESSYKVQRIWDNAAAAASDNPCQPVKEGRIYFAAAVKTVAGSFNGHQTSGYVVVPAGGSTDVVVNVFSTAALPHDVLLYVGKDKRGANDPSDMDKLGNTVSIKLSRQQVNNGSGVIMTVSAGTAARTGAGGDQRIVVRSVLEKDDYNDWPFIVRVK